MIFEVRDLRAESKKFEEKLKKIKVAAFDVDGVLTPGHVYFQSEEMGWNRWTHARDGYGMLVLQKAGIHTGIITGGDSKSVKKRFEENLGLDFIYSGNEDKREAYLDLLDKGYKDEEILYVGDEFFDIPLLERVGFSATVPTASHEVKESVDYITGTLPGMGAAREVIDMLRYAQNIVPEVPGFSQ